MTISLSQSQSQPHFHSQHTLNQQQYTNKSTAYLTSMVHAQGVEFAKMQAIVQENKLQNVLDLGCGGGHVTYHLAQVAGRVTAYDLLPEMVNLVTEQARERGLDNVSGQVGMAEKLPFTDGIFDGVFSRFSAHHWQAIVPAMQEIYRVLKVGGVCVMVDIIGNANPALDNLLQTIETVRDPSHVRDYALSEWLSFAENSGFYVAQVEKQHLTLDFDTWVRRMRTPDHAVTTLRYLLDKAADEFKQYYQVQADGTFTSEMMVLVLKKT